MWLLWLLAVLQPGLLSSGIARAWEMPAAIEVVAGKSIERIDEQAVYFLAKPGSELDLDGAMRAFNSGQFQARIPAQSGPALVERDLWMAVALKSSEPAATGPLRRVIGLGGIFVDYPRVYLTGNDMKPAEILDSHVGLGGELAPRYFTYIRTQTFDLPAGASRVVFINTNLNDRPTMGIFREGELGSRQVIGTLIKASFTLTLLAIGIVLAVVSISTRRWLSLFVAIGFGFVMIQVDASLYTTAFSDTPQEGRMIWEIVTISLIFYLYYLFLYAFRDALRLQGKPWLVTLALLLPLPLVWVAVNSDSTTDIIWAYYIALLLHSLTIGLRLGIERNLQRLIMALLLICVVAAILVEPYYLGRTLPDLTVEFIRDVIRLTAGFAMLIVVLVDVRRSSAERTRLTQEKLVAVQNQAETDRRLLEMERSYSRAREAATRRKQQLASASHDIRQPLLGLRSALQDESNNLSLGLQHRLSEAVDYLEELTKEYSDRDRALAPANEAREIYSLDLIIRAVGDMFAGEAKSAGIAFVRESADCQTDVPALALIRATSNLVANALRHSGGSNITLAVEHDDGCIISVTDNGIGMDASQLEQLQSRGSKGSNSAGDGLGLAIIHDLAQRHKFRFVLESMPGKGTVARIHLAAL